jgi:hypothetical protein
VLRLPHTSRLIAAPRVLPFVLAGLTALAAAQEGVPAPPGLVVETMWPAPTAADWQKPVLIEWQRTWQDAVDLAQATRRPILVCVNMDGEVASEHYAGIRYRSPEIAALYAPYVCVIGSVYRHNARDYDENGQRIPCPRFGGVTCAEHIALEPLLYDKFLDGKRIAPRHIMVELDGKKTYDVFLMWDTASVFKAITDGIKDRKEPSLALPSGDRSLLQRVLSPYSQDRLAVEAAFVAGDQKQRRDLLDAALAQGPNAPIELLRLAAASMDLDLARAARQGIAAAAAPGAVDLIADTLRSSLQKEERQALVAALARLGAGSPRAKLLATAHQGLAGVASVVDVEGWAQRLGGGTYAASDPAAIADDSLAAVQAHPKDPATRLQLAEASLAQMLAADAADAAGGPARPAAARYQRVLLEDAERQADEAERLGAEGWRLAAVRAVVAFHQGRYPEAYKLAEAAVGGTPQQADGRVGAAVLALFAEARQEAIVAAVKQKRDWPPQWLADVNNAYGVLAKHPFGTDVLVAHHYDFLNFFSAESAPRVLDEGLQRFPASTLLHERLRSKLLRERNPAALEAEYRARLAAPDAPKVLTAFAGYAALVAAEAHRRAGASAEAVAAYDRGIALYERFLLDQPEARATADHFVAMALGGKARIAMQLGDLVSAQQLVLAALLRQPEAAAALDGLNLTTLDTARMLLPALKSQQRDDLAAQLDAAMQRLDPAILAPPEYERAVQGNGRGRRRGAGR